MEEAGLTTIFSTITSEVERILDADGENKKKLLRYILQYKLRNHGYTYTCI